MEKEKIAFDLAKIYAQEMFRSMLQRMPAEDRFNADRTIKQTFCLFEDAYVYYMTQLGDSIDFSDVEKQASDTANRETAGQETSAPGVVRGVFDAE